MSTLGPYLPFISTPWFLLDPKEQCSMTMVGDLVTSESQTDPSAADFPASVCVVGVSTRAQLNTESRWTGFAQFFVPGSWPLSIPSLTFHMEWRDVWRRIKCLQKCSPQEWIWDVKVRPPLEFPGLWQGSLVLTLKMHGCAFQCRTQDRYGIQNTGYRTGCKGGRVVGRRQNKPALNISRDDF